MEEALLLTKTEGICLAKDRTSGLEIKGLWNDLQGNDQKKCAPKVEMLWKKKESVIKIAEQPQPTGGNTANASMRRRTWGK